MPDKARIKALLVDDEEDFLCVLALRLKTRGVDVATVTSGADALGYLGREPVDVVVLDVRMAGMDGEETLQEIRVRCPTTPVLMLTGFADAEVIARLLDGGAFDFLIKPVDIDELLGKLIDARDSTTRSD